MLRKIMADVIPDQDERRLLFAHVIRQEAYCHDIIGYETYIGGNFSVQLPSKQLVRIPNHGKFVIIETPHGKQTFRPGEVQSTLEKLGVPWLEELLKIMYPEDED